MTITKVFAVDIELCDGDRWTAWSTENVVASDISAAIKKALRGYSRYGAGNVRASAAKFVLAAR